MKSGAISAKVSGILSSVTLGVILSGNTLVFAESAISEAPSITLALNADNTWKVPVINITETNDLASKASLEALDKAMEKVSMKLEEQLENEIARKMDYAMH